MRQTIIWLIGIAVVVAVMCLSFMLRSREEISQPPAIPAAAASGRPQQPVGWVFGRLIGVQNSVYPRPAERMPISIPRAPEKQP